MQMKTDLSTQVDASDRDKEIFEEIKLHPNGRVAESTQYFGDTQHGWWRTWDEHGNRDCEAFYSNGVREGLFRRWSSDGTIWLEISYHEGKQHGVAIEYKEDGTKLCEGRYENDRPITGTFNMNVVNQHTGWHEGAIMTYQNGRFVGATTKEGQPLTGAYREVHDAVPGKEWNSNYTHYVHFRDGQVAAVTDQEGREIPRALWRTDFR
jgi:hypothetical protein